MKKILKKRKYRPKHRTPKSAVTRQMIITAAREVFARYPYQSATLRMIGQEGGFTFSLINHYFTKAELFEAVIAEVVQELFAAFDGWMEGVHETSPDRGLSLFLDQALEDLFRKPQAIQLFIQNIPREGGQIRIPGFELFTAYVAGTGRKMVEELSLKADPDQVYMWMYDLINLIISFIGFGPSHGQVLGINHNGPEYRAWVKNNLMYMFLPRLRSMFRTPAEQAGLLS